MTPARPDLKADLVGFNRGQPVRLLYFLRTTPDGDVWRVEPVFVTGPPRDELFRGGDRFKPVHGC